MAMRGDEVALICLAALLLYWAQCQFGRPRMVICGGCGDMVYLARYTFARCPSCKKLVAG
jgi:hypothetical protein